MRISDWSSDVCSSDLVDFTELRGGGHRGERGVLDGAAVMFDPNQSFHKFVPSTLPVRIERSRDAPQPCAVPMGVSTSLDTNGGRTQLWTPSAFSLATSSSTSATLTPAERTGGSATLTVLPPGVASTP